MSLKSSLNTFILHPKLVSNVHYLSLFDKQAYCCCCFFLFLTLYLIKIIHCVFNLFFLCYRWRMQKCMLHRMSSAIPYLCHQVTLQMRTQRVCKHLHKMPQCYTVVTVSPMMTIISSLSVLIVLENS